MKSGTYFVYHGKEYMDSTKSVPKGYKILLSGNKDDLNDGFYCTESENFMKKFGFVCEKKVPKSEITEAYEIRTYAVYKGVTASIIGWLKDNKVELQTNCLYGEDEKEFLKKMEYAGFEFSHGEQGGYRVYAKIVSLDGPDLQLLEHRTELDISKL